MSKLYAGLISLALMILLAALVGCGGVGAPGAIPQTEQSAAPPAALEESEALVTSTASGTQLVIPLVSSNDDATVVLDNLGKWFLLPDTGSSAQFPYPTNPPDNDLIQFAGMFNLLGGRFLSNSVIPYGGNYGIVVRYKLPAVLFGSGVNVTQAFIKVQSLTDVATDDGARLDAVGSRDGLGNLKPWGTDTPSLTDGGWPKNASIHGAPITYINGSAHYCQVPWTVDNAYPLVRHRMGPWESGKQYLLFKSSTNNSTLPYLINGYLDNVANLAQAQTKGSHLAFWIRVSPTTNGAFRRVAGMAEGKWNAPRLVLTYTTNS